jgi:hypothetical protein
MRLGQDVSKIQIEIAAAFLMFSELVIKVTIPIFVNGRIGGLSQLR